jgi:hypothetical protein
MKKEQFVKFINELVRLKKRDDEFSKACEKISDGFGLRMTDYHETLILDILKEAMDDKADWISYWLYDCEMGTKKIGKGITDGKTKKSVPFKTAENLYDCIKKY